MRFLPPTDQKCAESSTYWQFFYYRPPGKFRFTHLGEIVKMLCQELNIYIYIYMMLLIIDMNFQPWIDCCTTFHSFFSWKVWKKIFFLILKSWQVCDWLAKWIIMLRFMDLRWPRVFRRSNAGLVYSSVEYSQGLWGHWVMCLGNNVIWALSYPCLHKVPAKERIRFVFIIFTHWPKPCLDIYKGSLYYYKVIHPSCLDSGIFCTGNTSYLYWNSPHVVLRSLDEEINYCES